MSVDEASLLKLLVAFCCGFSFVVVFVLFVRCAITVTVKYSSQI